MKHTSFPLLSALPLFFILMYSNVCYPREEPANQEAIETMQKRFKSIQQQGLKNNENIRRNTQNILSEYSKNIVPALKQSVQKAKKAQQQRQDQFNQDMEAAKNDFDSKYTRMSGTELQKLGKQGDRRALAETVARVKDGAKEHFSGREVEMLTLAVSEMIKKEAKNQSVKLDDSENEALLFRVQQGVMEQFSTSGNQSEFNAPLIIKRLVTKEAENLKK